MRTERNTFRAIRAKIIMAKAITANAIIAKIIRPEIIGAKNTKSQNFLQIVVVW